MRRHCPLKIITKTRYAIRCVLGLAIYKDEVLSARIMSQHINLPVKYLEDIFTKLKRNHFIESTRGVKGGYQLAKDPKDITIHNIIMAMENNDSVASKHPHPDVMTRVIRRELWYKIDNDLKSYLSSISIADIIEANGNMERVKTLSWYQQLYDIKNDKT